MLSTEVIPFALKPVDMTLELRPVPGLDRISANQLGHVYIVRKGKTVPVPVSWSQWNRGWRAQIKVEGKKYFQWFLVRELVAWAFIGRPDDKSIKAWPIDHDWHNHTLPNLVQLHYREAMNRGLFPRFGEPRPWMNVKTTPSILRG